MLFIHPEICIDCGLCALECPVTAILYKSDLPEEWRSFIEKNAGYYQNRTANK